MNKLSRYIGKHQPEIPSMPDYTRPHPHTSIGIEVELEGITDYHVEWKRWNTASDGSLYDGVEFVSEPVWGTAITDALQELQGFLNGQKPHISFRTSVHIHMNVLDMTKESLANLLKINLMYEKALFRLHSEWGRESCIFCVPASESVLIRQAYATLLSNLEKGFVRDDYLPCKYSATNINSLARFGTVEFRHMGGTADTNKISDWINILLQMKTSAILGAKVSDPSDVWGEYESSLDIKPADLKLGRELVNNLELGEYVCAE